MSESIHTQINQLEQSLIEARRLYDMKMMANDKLESIIRAFSRSNNPDPNYLLDEQWAAQHRYDDASLQYEAYKNQASRQVSQLLAVDVPSKEIAERIDAVLAEWVGFSRQYISSSMLKWFEKYSPANVENFCEIIDYLGKNCNWQSDAIRIAHQGVQKYPNNPKLREQLYSLSDKEGNISEMIWVLQLKLTESPADLNLIKQIAQLHFKNNKPMDGCNILLAESKKYPNDLQLWNYMVECLMKANVIGQVIPLLEEKHPDNVQLWNDLIERLIKFGKLDLAVRVLKMQLVRVPDDKEIQFRVAELLISDKKFHDAMIFLNEGIEKSTNDEKLRNYRYNLLVEALNGDDLEDCRIAIQWLQEHEGKSAVDPLRELLGHTKYENIRLRVLEALVKIQQNGAIPSLWKGLIDDTPKVRSFAARMLGEMGDSSVVERLVQAFKVEKDESVLEVIRFALNKLDNKPRTLGEKLIGRRPWAR